MSENSGTPATVYKATRVVQLLVLIPAIGISANFVSKFVAAGWPENGFVWNILVTALVVACLAALYSLLSLLFASEGMPFLPIAIADLLFLVPIIVVIALFDRDHVLGRTTCSFDLGDAQSASGLADSLPSNGNDSDDTRDDISSMINAAKSSCKQMKALWACYIALT